MFELNKIHEKYIDKDQDKVKWKFICKYQKLNKTFIKKYKNI